MLRVVKPTFDADAFERDRARQAEESKARQAVKQQDKERRRIILAKMEARNKELYADDHHADDLDCLDDEDELAMLGKRVRQSAVTSAAMDGQTAVKQVYGAMRPPESRDDDRDSRDEADGNDVDAVDVKPNKQQAFGY